MTARKTAVKQPGKSLAKVPADVPARPSPSDAEARAIGEAREALSKRAPPPRILAKGENGKTVVGPNHSDGSGWSLHIRNTFGTASHEFVETELARIMMAVRGSDLKDDPVLTESVMAVLNGAKPENEIQAMLAIQMAVTHGLVMKKAGHLSRSETLQQVDSNALALARLSRSFTTQAETLAKLQRGGEQRVTVEHVHVYPGGQAIVGNVTHSPGTGGMLENSGQPYAAHDPRALALADGTPLLCQDPRREALPITDRTRQETLPDARRRGRVRSANG